MKPYRHLPAVLLALVTSALAAESSVMPPPPAPPPPAAKDTITANGQTFVLASTTQRGASETREFTLVGETVASWTQLLTVQRITTETPAQADEFVVYFRQRLQESGAALDVLKQGKTAAVFIARFPRSATNEEQVMVCLAYVEKPKELQVVQYAIKPGRLADSVVEMQLRAWRDRLIQQALTIAKPTG